MCAERSARHGVIVLDGEIFHCVVIALMTVIVKLTLMRMVLRVYLGAARCSKDRFDDQYVILADGIIVCTRTRNILHVPDSLLAPTGRLVLISVRLVFGRGRSFLVLQTDRVANRAEYPSLLFRQRRNGRHVRGWHGKGTCRLRWRDDEFDVILEPSRESTGGETRVID